MAAAALLSCIAGSSAAAEPPVRHVRSMVEIRNQQVVRQHWDLSCGAAAIATLLTYQLGQPVTEREVALAMMRRTAPLLVRLRLGFSLLDLKMFAASRGFSAAGYSAMTLDDLDAAAPAIVPIVWHGFRHFVIYRGRAADRVLIADPSFGNRTMSTHAFERVWSGRIGFVVTAPGDPNPANRMGAPAALFIVPGAQAERRAIFTPGTRG